MTADVIDRFLEAARAPAMEQCEFGRWTISQRPLPRFCRLKWKHWETYTLLQHCDLSGMHIPAGSGDRSGSIVMEDSPSELRKHLPIWLVGEGRILVTGLGLGCVVRGLLASPKVTHVDVVEIDKDILDVVGRQFERNPRVTLHHGDALGIEFPPSDRWDFAWHDLYVEDGSLHLLHAKLFMRFTDRCAQQGAWAFPRQLARMMPWHVLGSPRKAASP